MTATVEILAKPGGLPLAPQRLAVRRGLTVEEIALAKYGALDGIEAWVRRADGDGALWESLPRERWRFVRPLADGAVQFSYRPQGGKSGNLFATVAMIALAVVAPAIGASIAGFLFAGASAAFIGAAGYAIGAAISIGGSMLIQKLFPTAAEYQQAIPREQSSAYADVTTDGNPIARSAFLPEVYGVRRIAPPDIAQPYTYILDGIQTVDRVLALWGRHEITEVRVDGTPAASISAISLDIKDGGDGNGSYGFDRIISAPVAVGESLSSFALDGLVLEDQVLPANSSPRWHAFSTPGHESLEEITIRLRIDGFVTQGSSTEQQRLPLRLRMRPKGAEDWVNLPEIHIIGRDTSVVLREVRLRWDDDWGVPDNGGEVTYDFWREVPGVTAHTLPGGLTGVTQWLADDHFSAGAGLRDVANISGERSGVRITLDEAVFPRGDWEFQIMRGAATVSGALNASYVLSGSVQSLFLPKLVSDVWQVAAVQGGILSQVSVPQATAIAAQWPTTWPAAAKLELRSKGQSVRNITCVASRYVMDWNGSDAWDVETASSRNPATHYRQILVDWMDNFGLDRSLIDEAAFVAWRQECIDRGYECSAVFAGESTGAALAEIATAGFATPVFGDRFSVDWFRDRSQESPVQVFGLRNTESATFEIVAPQRPFGYRAAFQNRDDDWKDDEVEVVLGGAADIGEWEAVAYRAIDDEAQVRRRATFDLLQVDRRRRVWRVSAAIEAALCQRGDLISVTTDLIDDAAQSARIRQAIDESTLAIDQILPAGNAPAWEDEPPIADLFSIGAAHVAFIQTPSGVLARTIANVAGNVIVLASPLPSAEGLTGAPVNIVPAARAEHRMIVTAVETQGEERAIVTAVEERPEIFFELQRRFG